MKELQERIDDAIFFLETEYNTYPSGDAWRKALKRILEGNKIKKLHHCCQDTDDEILKFYETNINLLVDKVNEIIDKLEEIK